MNSNNSSSSTGEKSDLSKKNEINIRLLIPIVLITLILFLLFVIIRKCPRKKRRKIQRVEVVNKKPRHSRLSLFETHSGRAIDQVGCLADMLVSDRNLRPKITDGSSTTYALSTNSATHNSSSDRNDIEDFSDFNLMNIPLRRLKSVNKDTNDTLLPLTPQNFSDNLHTIPVKTTAEMEKQPFNLQVSISSKTNDESCP